MKVLEKLTRIQTKLKAPKNLHNSFGNYNYRNAEGIQEAVKPYLAEEGCTLLLSDTIENIGERYYIKATATFVDNESEQGDKIEVSAYAREPIEKKGMDVSQITGATSSYARKYALNGLFLLDDTKDADSDEHHIEAEKKAEKQKKEDASQKMVDDKMKELIDTKDLAVLRGRIGEDKNLENTILKLYKVDSLEKLNGEKFGNIMTHWDEVVAYGK